MVTSLRNTKQVASISGHSINAFNPLINLHGIEYCLTVYHRKSSQSEWTQVKTRNVNQLLKDINFRELIKQVQLPCSEIEIQASIYQDAAKNSVHCAITENGSKRKVNLSIDESLFTKISHIFEKNTKNPTNLSIEVNGDNSRISQWIQEVENNRSQKQYDSSFAKSLLEETKKDPRICKWLEEQTDCGRYWKDLHEKCSQPNVEFNMEDLQKFSFCLVDFNDHQFLEKEELVKNIKTAMDTVKAELKIVAKPIHEQVLGFNRKSMNCGFNASLQMILNEPVLLDIYKTVANYYSSKGEELDQLCGQQMFSVLEYYDKAFSEKQKAVSEDASNNLRLAMHHLSKGIISSSAKDQEDANEIVTTLLSRYKDILKQEELIRSLQECRKSLKLSKSLATPVHLKAILGTQVITEESALNDAIKNLRKIGEEKLLSTSLLHYKTKHTQYHKIEKRLPPADYSALNEDDALVKTTTEWDLRIGFNPKQVNLNLVDLLKQHFYNENVQGSELRKFMKKTEGVEASVTKEELELSALPRHLFISLGRGNKTVKFGNPIEIPEELRADSLNVEGHPSGRYELKSFIVHSGASLGSGHYIAYRKVEDQWVKCNDGQISYLNQEEISQALKYCYICFYSLKQA